MRAQHLKSKLSMKIIILRNVLLFIIVLTIGLTVASMIRFQQFKTADNASKFAEVTRFPDDVERVVTGYKYRESNDEATIEISGDRIIHRGRSLIGLRSNLVKGIFFETVHGKIKTTQGTLIFSAADAEWNADEAQPFVLKKEVNLSLNGKSLGNVKRAKIYFKQKLLVIAGPDKQQFKL